MKFMAYEKLPEIIQPGAVGLIKSFHKDREPEEIHKSLLQAGGFVMLHGLKTIAVAETRILKTEEDTNTLHIATVVVDEDERNKKFGKRLVRGIEGVAPGLVGGYPATITVAPDIYHAVFFANMDYKKESNYSDLFRKVIEAPE